MEIFLPAPFSSLGFFEVRFLLMAAASALDLDLFPIVLTVLNYLIVPSLSLGWGVGFLALIYIEKLYLLFRYLLTVPAAFAFAIIKFNIENINHY